MGRPGLFQDKTSLEAIAASRCPWGSGSLVFSEGLLDHLLAPCFIQCGLFRQTGVEKLVSTLVRGRCRYAYHLWILLMIEPWHRIFLDGTR